MGGCLLTRVARYGRWCGGGGGWAGGVGLVTCMPRDVHSVSLDVLRLESGMYVMSVVLAQT